LIDQRHDRAVLLTDRGWFVVDRGARHRQQLALLGYWLRWAPTLDLPSFRAKNRFDLQLADLAFST
jgi:hypothetical protein